MKIDLYIQIFFIVKFENIEKVYKFQIEKYWLFKKEKNSILLYSLLVIMGYRWKDIFEVLQGNNF